MSKDSKKCAVVILICANSAAEDELLSLEESHSVLLHRLRLALQGVGFNGVRIENTTYENDENEENIKDSKGSSYIYMASTIWIYAELVQFSVKLKLAKACRSKSIVTVIDEDCQVVLESRWNSPIYSPYAYLSSFTPSTSLLQYDCTLQNGEVMHNFQKVVSDTIGNCEGFSPCSPCTSVLLSGFTGSGKTSLVLEHAVRIYPDATVVNIRSGEVMARCYEENIASPVDILMEAFKTSFITTPCIVIFDDLDRLIAKNSPLPHSEEIEKVVSLYLQIVASIKSSEKYCKFGMLVVGCVELASSISSNVRELFDTDISIPNPIASERRKIIKQLYKNQSGVSDSKIGPLREKAMFSYADSITNVSFGAYLYAAYDFILRLGDLEQNTRATDNNTFMNSEICGHEKEKQEVYELLAWPRIYTELYKLFNVKPIIGILLYGPPGTGKTLLAKVCAQELDCSFLNIRIPDVVRGHIGTGEQKLRDFFAEAKLSAPCIVFIDEFQSIFTSRSDHGSAGHEEDKTGSSLSSALASCFDDLSIWNEHAGIESMVTVIAATNEPWAIDRSFLRSGRLEKSVYLGTLDEIGRKQIIIEQLSKMKLENSNGGDYDNCDDDVIALTSHTVNFTGADMKYMCRKAMMEMRQHEDENCKNSTKEVEFSKKQFLDTCSSLVIKKNVKPSQVSEERKEMYRTWC